MKDILDSLSTLGFNKEETEQNELILDLVDNLCRRDIEPVAQAMNEVGCKFTPEIGVIYPQQVHLILKKIADQGLLGLPIPEDYQGFGLSKSLTNAVMERLSRADASLSLFYNLQNSTSDLIYSYGTAEAKEKYLPLLARGERFSGFAFTEQGSGSDLGSIKLGVSRKSGKYVIENGEKNFISNSGIANLFIVLVTTDRSKGSKGLTAFILDMEESPGVSVSRIEEKLGLHLNATGTLTFENVELTKANVLGELDHGFSLVLYGIASSKIGIAAQAVGIADAAYRTALKYSKVRKQFGLALSKFQNTQFKIADIYSKIYQSRLAYLNASRLKDFDQDFSKAASVAKLFASEMAQEVTYDAIQLLGGYGYIREYDVERYYRDARITSIYEGTSEVQRIIISRAEIKRIY